jgi:hypothetical protein
MHGKTAEGGPLPVRPLTGAAAESARQSKARREADAAAARAIAPLARWNIRQAGGIDAVRSAIGTDAALEIAALAGLDTGRLSEQWARSEPARRQVSVAGPGGDYSGDPAHDPRVTKLILSGAPFSEINRVRGEVEAEYSQRAADRAARGSSGLGPPGAQGGSFPDSGLPTVPGESRLVRDP